jgi:uncharacterized protein YbcI
LGQQRLTFRRSPSATKVGMALRLPPKIDSATGDRPSALRDPCSRGDLKGAISTEVVRLFRQHTGRGPTRAKTTISDGVIVVTLADCLTTPEKQLLDAGERELVEQTRSVLHRGMRAEALRLVERLNANDGHRIPQRPGVQPRPRGHRLCPGARFSRGRVVAPMADVAAS